MRKINFNDVEASVEGSYQQLPAGAYVCAITSMQDIESREYVSMEIDIIQGKHANFFSGKFYADKPWSHRLILSYKDSALSMLKGRLQTITACNPGFDAEAAWNGGNLQMFHGKAVGVVFRAEEYMDKKTGEFKLGSPRPDRLCTLADITDPKNANPAPKMMKEEDKRKARLSAGMSPVTSEVPSPDIYAEEVPF